MAFSAPPRDLFDTNREDVILLGDGGAELEGAGDDGGAAPERTEVPVFLTVAVVARDTPAHIAGDVMAGTQGFWCTQTVGG